MKREHKQSVYEGQIIPFNPWFFWHQCNKCLKDFRREMGSRRIASWNYAGEEWETRCKGCTHRR